MYLLTEALSSCERHIRHCLRATVVALTLLTLTVPIVHGTQGVSLDLGAIAVDQPLVAGSYYRLPTLGVSNPGDEPAAMRMRTTALAGSSGRPLPDGWIMFEPSTFSLAPRGHQVVRMELRVPVGAAPGTYSGLLVAAIEPPPGRGTAAVGAAAGSRLTFTVRPASSLDALLAPIRGILEVALPGLALILVLVALAVVAMALRRRYEFRIQRRR